MPVSDKASAAIRRYLERGGRWFALHASNSVAGNQAMAKILGTRFITHPRVPALPGAGHPARGPAARRHRVLRRGRRALLHRERHRRHRGAAPHALGRGRRSAGTGSRSTIAR
ncbi:MAG: hypothetical protein WDN24_12700 [Sphingomonas sp.]